MNISTADFVSSSPSFKQCPDTTLPEFAFIGRSNVGKSSLINMITGRKSLAKVSQTPGKTRMINHFKIDEKWMLVDLPGYGFAKLSKTEREKLELMIRSFLTKREQLHHTFLLVDARHELQRIDAEFIQWLSYNGIPFSIIATKSDKLSRGQLAKNLAEFSKTLNQMGIPQRLISTSSEQKIGKEEILDFISYLLTA